MAHTNAWNEAKPAGTDLMSQGDDEIRKFKLDTRERMALQHYWNVDTADGDDQDGVHKEMSITPATTNVSLIKTNANQSLTGSSAVSAVDLGITWNTFGAPTAFKANVTNTASGAAALLLDLQVGGASRFKVGKLGLATLTAAAATDTRGDDNQLLDLKTSVNALRWGHSNAEYINTIGAADSSGVPTISFFSYHGPTSNTYRRASGTIPPALFQVDTAGSFLFSIGAAGTIDADFTPTNVLKVTSTQALGADGAVATPFFSFIADPNTGIYSGGADVIGFSCGNSSVANFNANGLRVVDGAASTPSLSFVNDSNTGFYRPSSDLIYVSLGGTQEFAFNGRLAGGGANLVIQGGAFGTGAVKGSFFQVGHNTSGSGAPGFMNMLDKGGTSRSIWVDSSGNVRTGTSSPEEATGDTGGTVVGTQTSSRETKNVLGRHVHHPGALELIKNTPVFEFTYKNGSFNEEIFTGIIAEESPAFAMDKGKSFNPVSAFGHTVLAIQELIFRLEQKGIL